jgi:dTDP-4-amino-4,6-dideoxygalactose transaminase
MSNRTVPYFNYPQIFLSNEEQFVGTFRTVGRRGAFILQKELQEFERNLAAYVGAKFAVGVANATDGLQMAFSAGGLRLGDEVIICSHTMVATASAVHYAGGIPVPVETGADHLIDPGAVRAAITPRTRAICPTHLNGRTCNMDAIRAIAAEHKLDLYEDAAQALGSKFNGQCAGTFGRAACISFYPAKVLGCLGDGGAVLTNEEEIYQKLLLLRDHGRDHTGEVVLWGMNSRLDNIAAAHLDFQLKDYPGVVVRRRAIAALYQQRLGGCPQLKLPPAPSAEPEHFDIFQNYEIEAENRNALKEYLKSRDVGTLIQWGGKAVHQFRALGFNQSLPRTDALFQRLLMLPLNMSLVDDDVHYVADCVLEFYRC